MESNLPHTVPTLGSIVPASTMAWMKLGINRTSGFNVSLPILDSIDAGNTLVTINQGFDNQAEAAVTACTDFLVDGKLPPDPLAYLQAIVITKNGGSGQTKSADARTELQAVSASPSP